MPDLFQRGEQVDQILNAPSKRPRGLRVSPILPHGGYDPAAGMSGINSMSSRSMYDTGMMEGQNVDDYRSDNQGGLALTGAFLGRTIGQGLLKTAQGFSMLGSAVGAGLVGIVDATGLDNAFGGEIKDENWGIDAITNNPVNKVFFDLEEKVKELMPVYHSSDWQERSVSDKFFNNFGEWMADQGADGVAFALSALIPSAAVSKLGLAATILGDASRGATALGRALAAAGATEKGLNVASKAINLAAQYGVQTSSEALFEAKDTGDQIMQNYLASVNEGRPDYARYKSINDLPDDLKADVKEKASGAMKNDYWWNMIALAPSNLFEIGLLNRFLGKAEKGIAKGISAEVNAGENIAADATRTAAEAFEGVGSGKFKRLSKSIYNAANRLGETRIGAGLSTIPKSIAAEGLYEENIQNQIQDMSKQYGLEGKSGYFLESGYNAARQALEAVTPGNYNDPKYKQTREAMFAGAVIGGLFGGTAGATSEFNADRRAKQAREANANQAVQFLNSAKSDFLKQDLYETTDIQGPDGKTVKQIRFDEEGNPIVNKAAVANFLGNQTRMSDLVNTEEYFAVTGQKEMAKVVRDERTTNWALSHLQSGNGDSMFTKLDELSKANPDELRQLGFDSSFYGEDGRPVPVTQRAEEIRKKVAEVRDNYEEAIRAVPADQTARIEELVRLKSRISSMNNQVEGLNNQKAKVALQYPNDPEYVKQIDSETRKLRALQENKSYLDSRTAELEARENQLSSLEESPYTDSLKRAAKADRAKLDASYEYHNSAIEESKSKIDSFKELNKELLDTGGYDSTIGKYNLLKNAGGVGNQGRSQDIKDAENRIVQLNGAIQEHQREYDMLKSPYDGALHYADRLASSFHQQELDLDNEENTNLQQEIPRSEFEPAPSTVAPDNTILPETTPETVRTEPSTLPNMELPQTSGNQADVIRDSMTTEGRLDTGKAEKFAADNLGKRLKVTYGNDLSIYGVIKQGSQGKVVFVQDNGIEIPIERLLGGQIKSITPIYSQEVTPSKTEQLTPQEAPVLTKNKQKEFTDTFYRSSLPYLAVGVNSTTGVDNGSNPSQERWFRTVENLNLEDGKYQLATITQANQSQAKPLLGDSWNEDLLYDANTIKTVLLKDGVPVKADQFGNQSETGSLVYTALNLVPTKDKIGVVEHKSYAEKREDEKKLTKETTNPKAIDIEKRRQAELGKFGTSAKRTDTFNIPVLLDPAAKVKGDKQEYISTELFSIAFNNDNREGAAFQTSDTLIRRGGYSKQELLQLLQPEINKINLKYDTELASLIDKDSKSTKSYTHQTDSKARFIVTKEEIENGTVDSLLQSYTNWRSEVLAETQPRIITVTSKGSGIRVREDLGPVQGRLTEGQTVNVILAKGNTVSDPSGKPITVKPGLAYAEYKGMVVPLTGRELTKSEQATTKELLKQWSRVAYLANVNKLTIDLSNAIDSRNNENIEAIKNKLTFLGVASSDIALSPDELQALYANSLTLSEEQRRLKQYLEDTIRFGDKDVNSIYIQNGNFIFGDKTLPQQALWNNEGTEELDTFLANKYLQISSRALATKEKFTEYHLENGEIKERGWNSYNDYLTSTERPDDTIRKVDEIPLRTSLAPIGEAQFRSVNLRYEGITEAVRPIRTDTQAYQKVAANTQEAEKQGAKNEVPFASVVNSVNQFQEGEAFRVEMRMRKRSENQAPFYIDYQVVDGKPQFVQVIKRDGTSSTTEPASFVIVRDELTDKQDAGRPSDLFYEYISISPVESVPVQSTESVEVAQAPAVKSTSFTDDVVAELNKIGNFSGSRLELEDFITALEEAGIALPAKDVAENYLRDNPTAISPKTSPKSTGRRISRGMSAVGQAKLANLAKEEAWLRERFPNIDVQKVSGLINGKYWGLFDSTLGVLLSTEATEGVAYHEAFHVASLMYSDQGTREGVYKEYRDRTGFKGSDYDVEEQLAEEFRSFVLSEGKYKFPDKQQSFFQKLWNAIKSFLGFGNTQDIESMFNRINDGGYANMQAADNLGITFSAPMKADLAESFSHTHALLEDMTVSFFDHFFADGNNMDTLFNVFTEGKQSILIEGIYDSMLQEYKERAEEGGLVAKLANEEEWNRMVGLHKQELANLGLKIINKTPTDNTAADENSDENLEIEGQKDNAQFESHIEFSSKEGMPKIVKFFLSSLPELEYLRDDNNNLVIEDGKEVLVRVPSAYGTDKVFNPEKLMNILGNQLAGITDINQMIATIKELSKDFPTLTRLISRMQVGSELLPTTASANEARFQTLFWQQFAKAQHDYYMTFLGEDGRVTVLNSTSETQQTVTREKWRTNLISQLNDANGIVTIQDNRITIDKKKVIQLNSISNVFDRAKKLGIEFSFPEKIKGELFKTLRINIDAIINEVVKNNQPVSDLYTRTGLDVQSRINTLTKIESETNPDSIERQHIGINNKTLYSLTLNHSLSLAINELNARTGNWFNAIKSSAHSLNSVVLEKLSTDTQYNIGLQVNEGIKRQTADGQETSKLTPADALANMINGIVNGYYSILRPGDKKLEYKLNFGEFVKAEGLVTRDGNYNAKVNKIFRGYLQDEFNRVFSLKEGYGSNIKEYNKHVYLPNGKLDLGLFNSILGDVKMPVINSVQESAIWIDENKDLIDANIKKFLEATTNQYGANARKLSVFKESMIKKGRDYVKSGEYILNGIDNTVVNKVLAKEGDRYNSSDILQFFRYIAVNQLIGNIEQTKLTTGAIEFYKDPLKRFSALTGTKKVVRTDPDYTNWAAHNMPKEGYIGNTKVSLTQDSNVRIVVVKDVFSSLPKDELANYREGLKANGLSKPEIDKIMPKFENINEADAQSWITLPAYRQLLDRTGDWSNAHESAYKKAIKGEVLTADDIFLFPILKPQGYGPQQAAGMYSPFFLKTSLSPLIPSIVRGTDLERMMHKMYRSDIDVLSTESAVKVGGKLDTDINDFTPLYNNVDGNATIDKQPFRSDLVSVLPAEYIGIQLDVAPIRKNSTTRGTQQEKIIMSNILNIEGGQEIVNSYKETISKLVGIAKRDMLEKLGIKAKGDTYVIPNRDVLLNYLEEQSIARGVPTNTLIGLREALTNDSTLDAVVNKDRIDSILASMVTNGAIKNKRNGEQRIQLAITGYGARVYEGNTLLTSDKLKSYVYDPKGTKPMEIMTALPKALVSFVEKVGGLAKFNQMIAEGKIDERILKGTAFRIPTQQLSSMVYYRIKEFLPYESGPTVVLPSVITTIAGSDFDIDKLSIYEKNFSIQNEGISIEFRRALRTELTKAGLIDQFRMIYDKLPEELTDEEVSNLVQYSKDAISDEEGDKMDDIVIKMQEKYTTKPKLRYIESDGDTQQALENKLLEIHEQVLSHPANFKNLIAPIGNEVLSGLAGEMVNLRNESTIGTVNDFEVSEVNPYKSAELMNMTYLLEQGQRFQQGKDLLGIAAKQNTHHILSQLAKLELKPGVKVWFNEAKGKLLRLDHTTDLAGKHQISDIISEFINGFVDIVKDQFTFDLNANKHTINSFFYLTRVGVPIESVTSFLNQPVIRKFIDERNTQESLISKGLPEAYRKSRYQTIESLRKELVTIAAQEPALYDKVRKFNTQMPHYYKDAETKDAVRKDYNNFTKEQLDKMILNPNSAQNAYRQLQVLDQFLQYQDDSQQLTNLMMLNSQDTDGVKKSLTRSYMEKVMYNEFMKSDSIFSNAQAVINDGLIKPYFDVVMEGENYFSSLFDTKSEKSNVLRHEFAHQIASLGIDDASSLMKKFENHMLAHLLQNITTETFDVSLSSEAIKSTVVKREDGGVSVQPPLLIGNDSAANSLIKLRKSLELPNEFVNGLFAIKGVDRTIGNYVDNLRLFNKRINKQQADILSGAATDLLNSNPSLAKRVFRTTMLQSGLNNSYMSYHNLLPAKFFHNFVRDILNVYRTQDVLTQNIIDDFYRNNWKDNTLVPSVESRAITRNGDVISINAVNQQYSTKLYVKNWSEPDGITKTEFFSLRNDPAIPQENKPKWQLNLYKYLDNDGDKVYFKRVNPLGLSEKYQETSASWKERSAMSENNLVDGEFISSEAYNTYTGYKPEIGDIDPDNIEIPKEVTSRLFDVANVNDKLSKQDNEEDFKEVYNGISDKLNKALEVYRESIAKGMTQEQAVDRAEKEITCK